MSISDVTSPESDDTLGGVPTGTPTVALSNGGSNGVSKCQTTAQPDVQPISQDNNNTANRGGDEDALSTTTTTSSKASKDVSAPIIDTEWPFEVDEMYKIAFKFFKDNEGKAFHSSYDQRNLMIAYHSQIKSGDYSAENERPLGAFDFVGHDRRNAWSTLQGMSKEDAQQNFVNLLDSLCGSFRPFVMAIKCDQQDKQRKLEAESEAERLKEEVALRAQQEAQEAERQAVLEKKRKYEEQKEIIKELLNKQTFYQFSSYAKKQYPNDLELQNHLIKQLQDQHFQQYMLQMVEQSADLNNIISLNLKQQQLQQGAMNNNNNNHNNNNHQSEESVQVKIEVPNDAYIGQEAISGFEKSYSNSNECEQPKDNSHVDEEESSEVEEYIEDVMHNIENASMWTRKDIVQFKEVIKLEGAGGILTIGHGEMATIRVPTHENGNCIFWEFATDYYDIGFGLFFEWNPCPDKQVSVHISESEGEDEEDDEANLEHLGNDVEKGSGPTGENTCMLSSPEDDSAMSVIIPIYRRESHNEVFAGSHSYPGKGVYLLKFDNSFSLWRSKTLYYRVSYTKEN